MEIEKISISVEVESEDAVKRLNSLTDAMERIKATTVQTSPGLAQMKSSFDSLGNTKATAALERVAKTAKSSKVDFSSLAPEVQTVAKRFAELSPESTKFVSATAKAQKALQGLSGTKIAPTFDEASDSLKRLSSALDDADVSSVADAFASLPASVQKAIQANAKLDTANNSTSKSFKDVMKSALSFGDVLKANIISDALVGGVRMLGNAVADAGREFVNFAKSGIETASNLQEVQNVVDTTFGSASSEIDKFAKSAATNFGLSELSAKEFTGTMGSMLKSMNLDDSAVLEMSTALTGLAGDMASFYNLDPSEAFAKLRSGISGETEPLKQLGINLSVANLEAYALSEGITTAYSAMTEAEKATLRYQYIMSATAVAQGDFAKTSDSYANQQRILQLNLENLSASIGSKILPSLTSLTTAFNDLLSGNITFSEFAAEITNVVGGIADQILTNLPALASAAGEIVSQLAGAITTNLPQILEVGMQVVGQVAQDIVSALPEVLSVGLAIITTLVQGLAEALPELIPQAVETVVEFAGSILDNLDEIIDAGFELIEGLAEGVINAVPVLVEQAPVLITKLVGGITTNLPQIIQSGVEIIGALISGLIKAIPTLSRNIPQIVRTVVNGLGNAVKSVVEVGKNIVRGLWNGITSLTGWIGEKVSGFVNGIMDRFTGKSGFDEHSPSKWAADVGIMLGKGLGNGITAGASEAITAAKDMAKQIKNVDFAFADARSSLPDFSKLISVPVSASLSMADPGKVRMPAQTIPNTPNSYNYYVAAPEAASYSVDYEPIDANSNDSDNIVNAIFAMASRLERAIQENSGRPVYVNGRDITRYQNQQNRMYGKTLQNT